MKSIALIVGLALVPACASAEDLEYGGHIKITESGSRIGTFDPRMVLAGRRVYETDLDTRIKAEQQGRRWGWQLHAEGLGRFSDDLHELQIPEEKTLEDRAQLFDLSSRVHDSSEGALDLRLDRAAFDYRTETLVLRVGRQAISWGNGLTFQVLDLFNPFSPVAIDKDYKTGSDLLYGQYLFSGGDAVELLIIPRRDGVSGELESDRSSFAAKLRTHRYGFELDLLAAEHYQSEVGGLGLSHDLGGGVLRSDLAWHRDQDRQVFSALLNYDRSLVVCGRNVYLFGEYFRNGYGAGADLTAPLDNVLAERLLRGEIFTVRRDYLAMGLQLEFSARLNQYLTHIQNLDDGSGYFQLRTVLDLMQDLYLTGGLNFPAGSGRSEFGGYVIRGTTRSVEPARSGYLKLAYYF